MDIGLWLIIVSLASAFVLSFLNRDNAVRYVGLFLIGLIYAFGTMHYAANHDDAWYLYYLGVPVVVYVTVFGIPLASEKIYKKLLSRTRQ